MGLERATPNDGGSELTVKTTRNVRKRKIDDEKFEDGRPDPEVKKRKKKAQEKPTNDQGDASEGDNNPPKQARKRKTKEEKEAEAMPLAARTNGLRVFIGAHVSVAKGQSIKSFNDFGQ